MLSFSPTHGVSYLIIPTLLGTAFAGGYHPYSSETLQCPSSVVYTTITPTTTITASTRVVTITVTPGGKDYLAKGQAYKTPEHKSSSFFISTLVEHKTPTVSPTPTPHSTPSPHPTPTPRSSPSPDPKPLDPDNPCPPAITAPTFGSITSTAFVTPLRTVTEIYEGEGTPAPPPTPPESKPDLGDPTIPAPPDPPPVAVPVPLNSPQNNPLVPGFSSPDFSPGGAPRPPDGLPAAQPAVAPGPTPAPGVSSPGGPPVAPGDSPPVGPGAPGVYTPGVAPQPGGATGIVAPPGTASGLAPAQYTGAADRGVVGVGSSMVVGLAGMLLAWL